MKAKIDTQTRMDPGASFMVDGGGPVLSALVPEECDRTLGQKLTEAKGRIFAGFAYKAKVRELEAWERFKVSSPERMVIQSKN